MTSRKLCSNTNSCKQPAATNCEGCSQALCTKHFIEHRQLLTEQLDIIIGERDQFQETLNQSTINSKIHPFIQQIDDWENKSIAKIREKAENLRSELFQFTTVHIDHLSKKLQDLSKKLREAKEHESFVETDLCNWNESVNVLRNELTLSSAFRISQCDTNPFIQNISIKTNAVQEIFERTFDNSVKTEENGQVAIHNSQRSYTEIRGKLEYTLNRHTIRLHIEYLSNNWAFFGVTSKSTPLQNHSYRSGSTYDRMENISRIGSALA
ncbi:hypothetical protein I4U23_002930 [Adineta vaga]|nr:hypothetical protein I4U23_002930 [Adineta vaga]